MIKAVVFDLDDTLISEEDYIRSGYRAVAKALREKRTQIWGTKMGDPATHRAEAVPVVEIIAKELFDLYREDSAMVFNRFLDRYGVIYDKEQILELVGIYRGHLPEVDFFSDVQPVLKRLREKGIRTGIISDGYTITQENKVKILGLEKLVDHVILTDRLGRDYWKPDIRSFCLMAQTLGVSLEEMMYVGDNPTKDFHPKTQLPITTVRIHRPAAVYARAEYRDGVREDHSIDSLYELEGLLEKNEKRT